MSAKEQNYYCVAFRFWGVAICGVFNDPESFTEEIGRLYKAFDAPSQIDTCSIRAYSESGAYRKAVEFFNKNGWNIKGLK